MGRPRHSRFRRRSRSERLSSELLRTRLTRARQKNDSVLKALRRLCLENFTHVAVQPLQIIPGSEHTDVRADADEAGRLDGLHVSSTQVRNALAAADFALAERLLGRPFRIAGRVLHGQKLARQLGTPTANVQLKRRRVPLTGVYLASAEIDGQRWPGVANIGVRPTVSGDGSAHLEIHLLDFAGDLYGRRLTVEFHHKLREEQRFASLEALKSAIDADIAAARAHWHAQPLTKSLK